MADSSFDVVSEIDRQEADNALNQAAKEVSQRYDFRGTDASVAWSGEQILIIANTEDRALAVLDVLQSKMIKRGISLKSLDSGEPFESGKQVRIVTSLKEGIDKEVAKKIGKIVRDEGPRAPRRRSRATRSASRRRAATTCRRSSRCSRASRTSLTSPCSSRTTGELAL
jgi:uncharacterized protein YajQ (UPF0234 family)